GGGRGRRRATPGLKRLCCGGAGARARGHRAARSPV
ncbi:MAG: hypothetical protein AVDCRST_MAG90-180, partial [uncultured Microvirga sp.]